jgi:hypothetical protein
MSQSPWSALLSVGLPMFLSILISMISVKDQDNLVAFRKGPRLRHRPRWECAENTPRAVVNLFPRCAGRCRFSGVIREKSRAPRITMRAQAHLERDGKCMIGNKSGNRVVLGIRLCLSMAASAHLFHARAKGTQLVPLHLMRIGEHGRLSMHFVMQICYATVLD